MGVAHAHPINSNSNNRLRAALTTNGCMVNDLHQAACRFPHAGQIFRSVDLPEEQKSTLRASRAALRCNRIQLDAEEAGPTSPVFFWCAEHVRQLEGESPFDNLMEVKS